MKDTSKTVYLGMIGDIMHPGLINIINEGAKYGKVMIGLFTDKAIATHKRLPYLTYEQRKNVIENIKEEAKPRHMDFGSGYEKRIRKKYYQKVKHAMAKGVQIKNSSSAKQIEKLIRNSGDKSITELTEKYEEVRYNR